MYLRSLVRVERPQIGHHIPEASQSEADEIRSTYRHEFVTDYIVKAASVWFIGFFPLAEIYVAVPAGFALGLDPVSIVAWSVSGNYAPIPLLHYAYEALARISKIRDWLLRFSSESVKARLDRHGIWFVLLVTPWTGVWVMAVTVKLLGMDSRAFLVSSLVSVAGYAVILVLLIMLGINIVD